MQRHFKASKVDAAGRLFFAGMGEGANLSGDIGLTVGQDHMAMQSALPITYACHSIDIPTGPRSKHGVIVGVGADPKPSQSRFNGEPVNLARFRVRPDCSIEVRRGLKEPLTERRLKVCARSPIEGWSAQD